MARFFYARGLAKPLAGAIGVVPLCIASHDGPALRCEQKAPMLQTAKCTKNEFHTRDTRLISFALPDNWNPKGAIANVVVHARGGGQQQPDSKGGAVLRRPYNPLSAESGQSITLLVKRYGADAKMGGTLHALAVGDAVEVKGPNMQWSFEKGKYRHYGMVAGGTGITPLVQAAEHILANDSAKVTMLTFNKTSKDVLLRDHLALLEIRYPGRFTVLHFVESDASGNDLEGSATSKLVLKEMLPTPGDSTLVMVCGRKEMTNAVAGPKTPDFKQGDVGGVLKELGYATSSVWKV